MKTSHLRTAILLLGLLAASDPAWSFERTDGVEVQCTLERNGQPHIVKEVWLGDGAVGDRHPQLGGAAAVVRPDAEGWPVIYFDNVVFKDMVQRDPYMSDFVFYHECAHATDAERNEIDANCEAYLTLDKLGLMTRERRDSLASTHQHMLRLASRYGGSGKVFWERTMACVEQRLDSKK